MTGRKGHVVSQLALLSPSIDCPLLAAIRLSWSLLPAALTMRALSAPPGKNHPSVRTVHFIQKQGWHWSIRIQQPVVKEEGSARPCREKTIVLSFFQKYGPLANWSCVGGHSIRVGSRQRLGNKSAARIGLSVGLLSSLFPWFQKGTL